MDKVEKLKRRVQVLKTLLETHARRNSDAEALLRFLTPLFEDIMADKIEPPKRYEYHLVLGKDNPFYETDSLFSEAHAQFVSALEDWESQTWYQEGMRRSKDQLI